MKIPEYFTDKELKCRCGCGARPKEEAVIKLYALRILYGKPIFVNSGARCAAHNKLEGGKYNSRHVTKWKRKVKSGILVPVRMADAFDLATTAKTEGKLIRLAVECGFNGIGIKDNNFLHIDLRRDLKIWTYK